MNKDEDRIKSISSILSVYENCLHFNFASQFQSKCAERVEKSCGRRTDVNLQSCRKIFKIKYYNSYKGVRRKRDLPKAVQTIRKIFTKSVGFHSRGRIDCVTEQAVARHLETDHARNNGPRVEADSQFELVVGPMSDTEMSDSLQ